MWRVTNVIADHVSLTVTLTHPNMNVMTHQHLTTILFTYKYSENILFYCQVLSALVYKT